MFGISRAPRQSRSTKTTRHSPSGGRNCSTRPTRPRASSARRRPGGLPRLNSPPRRRPGRGVDRRLLAAYAAQRAEIGPRGYEDRIYRRKARATPRVHALTAEAERLLTLRETHRINGIPAVTFGPRPIPSP